MSTEKPFGWRPLTSEQKKSYVALGWSTESIEEVEKANVYQPVETAVLSYELASAILFVATRRFGSEFATEVKDRLTDKASIYENGNSAEDHVEGKILSDFLDRCDWDQLIRDAGVGPT